MDWWVGTWWDVAAIALFLVAWTGYAPVMRVLGRGHSINLDMASVRLRWMRHMALRREGRLIDGQLIGHILNSASFFASSNLILIAATAGVLFGGDSTYRNLRGLPLLVQAPRILFTIKIALVTITLARSLLDFIWSIRQLNYCIALVGAAPDDVSDTRLTRYADICGGVFNNALSTFNSGVRGYYFALAAAAWIFGPTAFAAATIGAAALLGFRQLASPTAVNIRHAREVLEDMEANPQPSASEPYAATPAPIGQVTPVPPIPQ